MSKDMKKAAFFLVFAALAVVAATAQELSLDQILEKHFKASGLDLMQEVRTITLTGTITQNDVMPVKITRMRPDRYLMEFDVADMTAMQGYDGKTAWMTAPWTGNAKAQPMSGDRLTDMKNRADFDGLLFQWKEKGHTALLEGADTLYGFPVYRIKLTRADGGVEYYFIDEKSFLQVGRRFTRLIRGQETIMEGVASDFRNINGIPFAFQQVNYMAGNPYNTIQFDKVEINLPVDTTIFRMP